MSDDNRKSIAVILILLGFGLLGWIFLGGGRGGFRWSGSSYTGDRPPVQSVSLNTRSGNDTTPPLGRTTPGTQTSGDSQCSEDKSGNEAPMLQSTAGTTRVVPVNGLGAARVRSGPGFGQNVLGCLRSGSLVSPTGRVSGTWSQVKLADNSSAWIATNQLN
jgi:Bacterial SH3 domain